MRSTLFYIPHADPFLQIPLFGFGWVLLLLAVTAVSTVAYRIRAGGLSYKAFQDVPILLVFAAAIYGVAPLLEQSGPAAVPLGIPIRAYGVLVLLGIVSGMAITVHESRRMGIDPEAVFSLCFWMIIAGFCGARLFYVIEYWEQFAQPSWRETLVKIVNLTDGGLVVYGSFIGATIAVLLFVVRHKLPLLALADLLAPGLMLGLAFGRIGCLMNGCCWGGACEESWLAITFPQGSPPFMSQLERGSLLGMRLEKQSAGQQFVVREVLSGGKAERAGIQPGDVIDKMVFPDEEQLNRMRSGQTVGDALLSISLSDGRRLSWEFRELPLRSQQVYPAQILSAINAALICLFLWAYYPFRRHDGEVFALTATVYPTTRILLEIIRTDEASLLPSDFKLTVSQAISGSLLAAVVTLWCYILSRPPGSALPIQAKRTADKARR